MITGTEWVLIPIILSIIGIIAIAFFIRYMVKKIPKRQSNLDILKNRLAKGEITKDEYDKLRKEF